MQSIKNTTDLAVLLKALRQNGGPQGRKMPAHTLAQLAGVSRDTIFRMERGEDVSFDTALRVLRVFEVGLKAAQVEWPTLGNAAQHFQHTHAQQ